ncbi:hypothetical protein GGR53DRAFT_471368 [Hypoxylon sp. FL1150]|nr:hypothetical protein GGR53DRAFT_471368 [Hypoxylon sp. FL1150]
MASLQFPVCVAPPIRIAGSPASWWPPIPCTFIYLEREAVHVDTPITTQQTEGLITWIEGIAPHLPLAAPTTVKHIEQQVEEGCFNETWDSFFLRQIQKPFKLAQVIQEEWHLKFKLDDRWGFLGYPLRS